MPATGNPAEQPPSGAEGLKRSTEREERKVESEKGSDLKKGADRFEERSRSSDGHSAGEKQRAKTPTQRTNVTGSSDPLATKDEPDPGSDD